VPELVVITPSRGRPRQLARLAYALRATTDDRVGLLALIDDDDPWRGAYLQWASATPGVQVLVGPNPPSFLASFGDDHLPRTTDWDITLTDAIRAMDGPGWAYGNDLLQGERLPTAWVQHRATVDALGWMMPPTLGHMYPDNAVYDVAHSTGRLAYAPGVIIEHLHPAAGKAPVDESYTESNAAGQFAADRRAYTAWQQQHLHADRARVAALTWEAAPC
jgi:hypothetical protein